LLPLFLALAPALGAEAPAAGLPAENVGFGPFRIPSQSPLQSLRLGYIPRAPSTLGEGDVEARASIAWVNLWAPHGAWGIDMETLQSDLSVACGLGESIGVEAGLDFRSRFGGVLDGLIEGYHDLLHIQDGRADAPRNDFRFELRRAGSGSGATLTNADRGLYSASLRLAFLQTLTPGTREIPAVAYAVAARGELRPQDDFTREKPIDLTASLAASKRLGDFYLYAGLGLSWFGRERLQDVALDAVQWSCMAAVEWRFAPSASFVLQYLISSGIAEHLGAFSEPSQEIHAGVIVGIAAGTALELGVIENFVNLDNSPDFGVFAGVRTRF
jgi:hypothetical protein